MAQFNKTGYFTNKEGVCSSTLKAKVKKNAGDKIEMPIVPKRVCTPYTYWIKVKAKECMEKNKIPMTQASSMLSKQWNEMSEKQKQPYVDMSIQDQTRHQKQVDDLEKLGYFTLEDGTKSSSLKPKIKKIGQKRARKSSQVSEADQEEPQNEGGEVDSESESEIEAIKPNKKRQRKN